MSIDKKLLVATHVAIAKALATHGPTRPSQYFGVAYLLDSCAFVFDSPELKAKAHGWREAARRLNNPLPWEDVAIWD